MQSQPLCFAAIDVETTGFNYRGADRVIEIAIVRMHPDFHVVDEFVTLVNPNRDVGRSDIHGIMASDVVHAPPFTETAGDIASRLSNTVVVGHNLRFDLGFLASEFRRADVMMPPLPSLCTLALAYRDLTDAPTRKLAACCKELGIELTPAHDALGDAQATASLLAALARRGGLPSPAPLDIDFYHGAPPARSWHGLSPSGRSMGRSRARELHRESRAYLARLVDALPGDEATSAVEAEYLSVLDRVLEDRAVTRDEAEALIDVALDWGMSRVDVIAAHGRYLRALVGEARADGVVTVPERSDLETVRELLGLPPAGLQALLNEEYERLPVSPQIQESESLVGKSVCFTGTSLCSENGVPMTRERAQELAGSAGLVVLPRVTKKLDILVVADPSSASSKAKKAREYGTRVLAEVAFWRALGVRVD